MRVVVIYKDNTEHARSVIDFLHDFEYQTGHQLETIDPDTHDGVQLCELYDVLEFPAIIATSDDGSLQRSWTGLPFPTINELSYYTQQP